MKTYVLTTEQQKLVEENMMLVPFTLLRYCGRNVADDEDIKSIGMIGLCNAAASYDQSKGNSFSTYAVKCIYHAVMSEFRRNKTKKRSHEQPLVSLNHTVPSEDGEEEEFMSFVPDMRVDTENEAINHILYEQALPYVPTFKLAEEEGLTLSEIAKRQHRSKSGICLRMQREYRMAHDILTGKRSPIDAAITGFQSA